MNKISLTYYFNEIPGFLDIPLPAHFSCFSMVYNGQSMLFYLKVNFT